MSIRNYRPKPDSRRRITPWRNFTLVAVLTVALALQLSYPLIEGERLRLVTIATVYWAAGAMLLHALFAYGFTYAIRFLLITFITDNDCCLGLEGVEPFLSFLQEIGIVDWELSQIQEWQDCQEQRHIPSEIVNIWHEHGVWHGIHRLHN